MQNKFESSSEPDPSKQKPLSYSLRPISRNQLRAKYELWRDLRHPKSSWEYRTGEAKQYSPAEFITNFGLVKTEASRGQRNAKLKYFLEQEILDRVFQNSTELNPTAQIYKAELAKGDAAEHYYVHYPGSEVARNSPLNDKIVASFTAPKNSQFDTEEKVDILVVVNQNYTSLQKQLIQDFYGRVTRLISGKFNNGFETYLQELSPTQKWPEEYSILLTELAQIKDRLTTLQTQIKGLIQEKYDFSLQLYPQILRDPQLNREKFQINYDPILTSLLNQEREEIETLEELQELFEGILGKEVVFEGFQVKSSAKGLQDHEDKYKVGSLQAPSTTEQNSITYLQENSRLGEAVRTRFRAIEQAYSEILKLEKS